MISFLVDQNFNEKIVDGLTRQNGAIEFVHVRDVDLATAKDLEVLEWAAQHNKVLLTHDRKTMPAFAFNRVTAGISMPGVFIVSNSMAISQAISELFLATCCMSPDECKDLVTYFPR